MEINDIAAQIRRDEGLRLTSYRDTLGFVTIGYGHKLELQHGQDSYTVTAEDAEQQLQQDIEKALQGLVIALPWFTQLDLVRQGVLTNMAFQLGVAGLLKFHRFLTMLEAGNYAGAGEAMLESLWAEQTPERARRLSRQIISGVWQ